MSSAPDTAARAGGGRLARRLLVVGLTGGIATGKSTVAALLRERGATVIDADQTARQVVQPGEPGLAEIVRQFGAEMLREDGSLDRARLGELVFGCEAAREALNEITHPRIAVALEREIEALDREARGPAVIVIEAAVLGEAGWDDLVDTTVVVRAKQSQQVARLKQRYGLDHGRARARVHSQKTIARLQAGREWVVDASGTLAGTRRQADELWSVLAETARTKFEADSRNLEATAEQAGP
jgi:dephospho-CoA kinase